MSDSSPPARLPALSRPPAAGAHPGLAGGRDRVAERLRVEALRLLDVRPARAVADLAADRALRPSLARGARRPLGGDRERQLEGLGLLLVEGLDPRHVAVRARLDVGPPPVPQ